MDHVSLFAGAKLCSMALLCQEFCLEPFSKADCLVMLSHRALMQGVEHIMRNLLYLFR